MTAEYQALIDTVLTKGVPRRGEKPEGTLTVFGGLTIQFDFESGFPLLTIRDLSGSFASIIRREIMWMLSGSTSAKEAEEKFGLKLWNRWAEDSRKKLGTSEGELGPVYGRQLRNWNGHTDQLTEVINMLKRTPETRRALVNLWNLDEVEIGGVKKVNVANCITSLHFARMPHRLPDGNYEERLDLIMTHRSADLLAGAPHDWAAWGILQMLVAKEIGIPPGTLTAELHDTQIYDIQREHALELLKRQPLPRGGVLITGNSGTVYDYKPEDFQLVNYKGQPRLAIPTAT